MKTSASTERRNRSSSKSTGKSVKKNPAKSAKKDNVYVNGLDIEDKIRKKAFELYFMRIETGEAGSSAEDWLLAEQIVMNENM